MSVYTQSQIDELISMPKVIAQPPKRVWDEERGSFRNEMALTSEDGTQSFTVFMRRNRDFPENFSVGLCYWPRDSARSIDLMRCNGPHGDINRTRNPSNHFMYHIHRADAELLNAGLDPLGHSKVTTEYASDREGIVYFCRKTSVRDFEKYFPANVQMDFTHELPQGDA